MNLRKTAGLLMAFGLVVGLLGTGVGATFVDQVTATENIEVGTFGCQIVGGNGTIGNSPHAGSTITYNAPKITSSAAGNAPFTFTVKNFGTIPQELTITASAAGGSLNSSKFTAMTLAPASPVALGASDTQVFDTGIQWTELNSNDLGDAGSITWRVTCDEAPATQTSISGMLNYNAAGGWAGHSCPPDTDIVSAGVALNSDGTGVTAYPVSSVTLWKLGASVADVVAPFTVTNYPSTPFGYNYTSPTEEGAIVQGNVGVGTEQSLYIVLECTLP